MIARIIPAAGDVEFMAAAGPVIARHILAGKAGQHLVPVRDGPGEIRPLHMAFLNRDTGPVLVKQVERIPGERLPWSL